MNQRDALVILYEATAELPENKQLRQARRWAEKRLEVLRLRYARMTCRRQLGKFQEHLQNCKQCIGPECCAVGEPLLKSGMDAMCEARGEPTGSWGRWEP